MPLQFRDSVDKHGVPRRSTWYVFMTGKATPTTTNQGKPGTLHIGVDDRGVELEIITVRRGRDDIAIHAMPSSHRHQKGNRS
ncbi:MAG: hypothetical protein LBV30_05730 [Propionibacteriaceae bacterium]|jgi:nicotinamide mononucleotide (NMN) deamidase PncC|nr:hypothetical protein [Propionibacteriaceae bacterium]